MDQKQDKLNQILEAATIVFAESGYAGARMDMIAERAGVNKATIYYNIGNKEKLYEKVLQSIFGNELSNTEEKMRSISSPVEKLELYITSIAEAIDRNPAIPNIVMWEHASGGMSLPEIIAQEIAGMIENLALILDAGEKQGLFKKINPMLVQFMIIPALMFYKTSSPIRDKHHAFPEIARNLPLAVSGKFANEMVRFILEGLKK
ncbi:MAG: TetR/AcrR family transcriptional regulator [Proteobacteria bacterium]|nr:TetR/AcrR family transcriptional regulator [Pseudomonadota bacterium]